MQFAVSTTPIDIQPFQLQELCIEPASLQSTSEKLEFRKVAGDKNVKVTESFDRNKETGKLKYEWESHSERGTVKLTMDKKIGDERVIVLKAAGDKKVEVIK